jgi:translation initiation factor 4A
MNGTARLAALNKFRGPPQPMLRPPTRILVVNEVSLKAPDVFQVPLIINYGNETPIPWFSY